LTNRGRHSQDAYKKPVGLKAGVAAKLIEQTARVPGTRSSAGQFFGNPSVSVSQAEPVTIAVDDTTKVSGLWQKPPQTRACLVLAHGAGAGMTHPFMSAAAAGLAKRNIATLRYQFPYMRQRLSCRIRCFPATVKNIVESAFYVALLFTPCQVISSTVITW